METSNLSWEGTSEDEIDEFDKVNLSFMYNLSMEMEINNLPLKWIPWKRAVFLKLMEKSINLKVLRSRAETLWILQWGCEIADMEWRLECLNHNILMAVRNYLGRAMKVDITTRKAVMIKYARVCVEMQLNQPLEYEDLH